MNPISENIIHETLSHKLSEARTIFNTEHLFREIIIPTFDCSNLPPSITNGNDLPEEFKRNFFGHLHAFDISEKPIKESPCLYVFELDDQKDGSRVVDTIKKVDSENIKRVLPVFKKTIPDSKYLYVGKRLRDVGGRLVEHLGYHQKDNNHGLQLAFWARQMHPPLKIIVHVFRFEKEMTPYMGAFENILAKELKPIVGTHK